MAPCPWPFVSLRVCGYVRSQASACGQAWQIRGQISRCACCNAAYLGLALGNASPTLGLGGMGITGELRWALESLLDYSVFMRLGFNLGSRRCGAAVFAAPSDASPTAGRLPRSAAPVPGRLRSPPYPAGLGLETIV